MSDSIKHHADFVVEGIHTAVLVIVIDGGQRIIIAYAVQTVGVVVVRGCLGLGVPVLRPVLRMGGKVAAVVGVAFGKLTLRVTAPAAQQVIRVIALPVVGHAAIDTRVITDRIIVKIDRLLACGMDDPWLAIKG